MKKIFVKRYLSALVCTIWVLANAYTTLYASPRLSGEFGQTKITGIVLDELGSPLPGASVVEKGTTNGVDTDLDGNFAIGLSGSSAVLVVSFIGYKNQEVTVGNQTNLRIRLELDVKGLEEVVLVGYGTETRSTQASSVSSIKASDINNIPTSQLSTSLAGRLPGIQIVQNTGFVGGGANVKVRGASLANPPLYVIDDVVSDKSQFDVLDPSEVENISILKDAASASIYGSRASGGVVVVKTKSGKASEKVAVNYRGILTSYETTQPLQNWTPYQETLWSNQVAYTQNRLSPSANFQLPYDQAALDYAKTLKIPTVNDYLWKTPTSQQHGLDVSGGNEKIRYFFGANYNENKGSYEKTKFDKYTLRAKVDATITKHFSIGSNLSFNKRDTDRFFWPYDYDNGEGFTVADFYRPTFNLSRLYPFYQKANGDIADPNDPGAYPVIQPNWGFNPAEIIKSVNYRKIGYNTFNAILDAKLKIPSVEGLSVRFQGNYRQDNRFQKDFIGEFNKSYRSQTQGTSGIGLLKPAPLKFDTQNTVVNSLSRSYTGISENFRLEERYQLNAFIDYARSFGKNNIESFLGYEQYQYSMKYASGDASESVTPNNDQILATNASAERRYFDGFEQNQARVSYFGRAKYVYADKYIAAASFRYDGSYIFAQGKRFGFFPSVSAAWVVSNEEFFAKNIEVISNLKLRASYGTTGYDGNVGTDLKISPFQYQTTYNFMANQSYVFAKQSSPLLAPRSVIANPDITWSINKTFNYGLDVGLFKDSWTLSVDYFITDRTNILVSTASQVPGTLGSGLPTQNIGEQSVQGFEFVTNYSNTIGEFEYSVGLNVAYAIDSYVKWPQAANIPQFQNVIGLPTEGVVRGYISEGIVKDQAVVDDLKAKNYTQFGRPVVLGSVLIKDINGDGYKSGQDGKVDTNDQTILSKNAIPRINYGIPIDFKWRNFSLSLFLQGVGPYDKFVTTLNTKDIGGGAFQLANRPYFQLWTEAYSPEYNPNGKYPAASGGWLNPDQTGVSTSFWKYNGAYMRLKNMNVAYTIPKAYTKKIGISNFQINFNATNLFTLSAFDLYDPEQEQLDSYPIFRSYSAGINLSF